MKIPKPENLKFKIFENFKTYKIYKIFLFLQFPISPSPSRSVFLSWKGAVSPWTAYIQLHTIIYKPSKCVKCGTPLITIHGGPFLTKRVLLPPSLFMAIFITAIFTGRGFTPLPPLMPFRFVSEGRATTSPLNNSSPLFPSILPFKNI